MDRQIKENYERLAEAIVSKAIADYRSAYRRQLKHGEGTTFRTKELEDFFKSDWFKMLCNLDGQWIIESVQAQIRDELEVDDHE